MAIRDGVSLQAARSSYLAKSVHKSGVVLQAVHGHIRSPSTEDVVFGKETALELVVISEDGIVQSVCEQSVFGMIRDLRVLPWNPLCRSPESQGSGKDLLVVLSDSGKLSFLTFCMNLHRFLAVSHRELPEATAPCRKLGKCLAVHPWGRAVAVGAFEDRLAIMPASISAGNNIVEQMILYPPEPVLRISSMQPRIGGGREFLTGWGSIWSMSFVCLTEERGSAEQNSKLVLAVLLHRRGALYLELQILVCNTQRRSVMVTSQFHPSLTSGSMAYCVLDVPAVPGFLIILRYGDLMLIDVRSLTHVQIVFISKLADTVKVENSREAGDNRGEQEVDRETIFNAAASALLLLTQDRGCRNIHHVDDGAKSAPAPLELVYPPFITAWNWEPGKGQPKLILAMDSGKIHMARFVIEGSNCQQIEVGPCQYTCAPCNALLWTKGGFLVLLVQMGAGQVLQVRDSGLTHKSFIAGIAPIVDFKLTSLPGETQNRIFACSGVGTEGTIRAISHGISVDKLLSTPPIYTGVSSIWTLRMRCTDENYSFLVISFVGETRVLSVGLNFVDITEDVGFQPSARTLACGRMMDGWLAQIWSKEVRLCSPTSAAHPEGLITEVPSVSCWNPETFCISLGAVAQEKIILALSQPGLLLMLGISFGPNGLPLLVELQRCLFSAEISCISIPLEEELISSQLAPSSAGLVDGLKFTPPTRAELDKIFVVGTYKPSVELLSLTPGEGFRPLATGIVTVSNANGAARGASVPESVRLALFDDFYILAGLRNGMLLRYEWPDRRAFSSAATGTSLDHFMATSEVPQNDLLFKQEENSVCGGNVGMRWNQFRILAANSKLTQLDLVAVRRIGISPVSLIPLGASLRSDILALSDRPWRLQTRSPNIVYRSISFQPSTYATPVNMSECPNGILFVADCSLHLVEMENANQLNMQSIPVGKTPRRVVYHTGSEMLLVTRTEFYQDGIPQSSDICCVDPVSGTLHSCYTLDSGETARSMCIWELGQDEFVVVGTCLNTGPTILPNGEPESGRGRLLVFEMRRKHTGRSNLMFWGSAQDYFQDADISKCSAETEGPSNDGNVLSEGEAWELSIRSQHVFPGIVLAVSPYMSQYLLASAGNALCCLAYRQDGGTAQKRLSRLAVVRTRFMITSISVHLTRIAVGDCRDGLLLYTYSEDPCRLELMYCDPVRRLLSSCALVDEERAVATDWLGNFCMLTSENISQGIDNVSPERNLSVSSWYHVGETVTSISKGPFSYRNSKVYNGGSHTSNLSANPEDPSVVACSALGSVIVFRSIRSEDYDLLMEVQSKLAIYPLTAPLLGNDHAAFRRKGCPAGACEVLDGDMLWQFFELTGAQQREVLALQLPELPRRLTQGFFTSPAQQENSRLDLVLRLMDRVHNAIC